MQRSKNMQKKPAPAPAPVVEPPSPVPQAPNIDQNPTRMFQWTPEQLAALKAGRVPPGLS
jgi:hypothetical protein